MNLYTAKIDFENNRENLGDKKKNLDHITNNFFISYPDNYKDFDLIKIDNYIIFSHSRFENLSYLIKV